MSDQQSAGSAAAAAPATPEPAPASSGRVPAAQDSQPTDRDWTDEVTDRLGSAVSTVRDKTTVPVTKVARAVVFGLIAGTLGLVALILFVIALVRVINVYLPFEPYGRRVWVTDAGLGAIFLVAGAFCWSRRTPRKS